MVRSTHNTGPESPDPYTHLTLVPLSFKNKFGKLLAVLSQIFGNKEEGRYTNLAHRQIELLFNFL
jgi:hypothetical protein